jgi:hypothetical protein
MASTILRPALLLVLACTGSVAAAQTPQPFPRPGETRTQKPAPAPPAPAAQAPAPEPAAPQNPDEPTEAMLGMPVYPGAQFLASYNAGRGQRYYLFGTNLDYAAIVNFYKTVLRQRGDQVFDEPPVHMFEVGRFREDSMAFPPGVTVKDYTWAGSAGYLNPKRGAEPARFKTVIQIVPPPAGAGR